MEGTSETEPLVAETSQDNEIVSEELVESLSVNSIRVSQSSYKWTVFTACINTLVHSLIGASVFVTLWFAFKSTPISAFQLHIGLSVIGYQLLMSHGLLSMNSCNSWSSVLSYKHRRRVHLALQVMGSALAIAGSVVMMTTKSVHFQSLHGKLALSALVLTCASLLNGVTSLYTRELRAFIPPKFSKYSHVLLGTAAFATSTACLATGYLKGSFREWSSQEFAYVMIAATTTYTVIIVVSPCFSLWKKVFIYIKLKIY